MIKIKDKNGKERLSVEVSDKAIYRKELMAEEYVLLTFNTAMLVNLQKGDYIDCDFGRFEIVRIDKPKRNTTTDGGWHYEQKFHALWEKWTTRKLFYNRQRGSEKSWSLTHKPEQFMQIVVDNIREAGLGEYAFNIDATLTDIKLVEFDGDNIVAALTKIAEAWETEWWVADDVIHLSKCEYGSAVVFEQGDVVADMERSDGQDTQYATRLYAFGSTRNIPTNYRKSDDEAAVIEGVVERRLKLPEGIDHLDAWTGMDAKDVVEAVAVFEEIYPRRVGTIDTISTAVYRDEVADDVTGDTSLVEWNAYRFTDPGIKFSKDYILPSEDLRVIFQSGALAGMDFAVTFNPDGHDEAVAASQVYEIIRNDTYGINLPNENFHPKKGDTYILYGFDTKMVSAVYIPQAEQELLTEARKLIAKLSVDGSVYSCPTNPIRCAGYIERKGELVYNPNNEIDLDLGQRIELRNENYFSDTDGYRISRIRAFEKRLDNKFAATYEVGETAQYSRTAELDEKMQSIATLTQQQIVSMGGGIYLIKRHDGTKPSDHNAFSALRAKAEFLHKQQPDVAQGLIKFLAGLEVGYYSKGVEGGKFDDNGDLEARSALIRGLADIAMAVVQQIGSERFSDGFFGEGFQIWKAIQTNDWHLSVDRLTVRKLMTIYELIIQKIRSVGGQLVVSAANGKIKSAERQGDNYRITFEDDNTFAVGDLVRCQMFTGANPGTERINTSITKSYWVRVSAADLDGITVPASEFEGAIPEPGDECVMMGNTENPLRQNLISISATDDGQPRIDVLNGVHEKHFNGCLRTRLGNLDDITDTSFPADNQPHGDGLYGDNVYLRGAFVLSNGDDVKTRFEILEGRVTSEIQSVEKELMGYESCLHNAYFNNDMAGWETDNGVTFFLLGNKWLWVNDAPYANKDAYTGIATDRNRNVLYIKNRYLLQRNENFESHPDCSETDVEGNKLPKKFYLSFYYRCITPGKLTIQFENADTEGYTDFELFKVEQDLEASGNEYVTFEVSGLWNGTGDFRLSFSGEIYLYAVRLSLDRIADIEQRYRTLFEQTDKAIALWSEKILETTRKVEQYRSEFRVEADKIRSEVSEQITDLETGLTEAYTSAIEQTAREISMKVDDLNDGLEATGIDIKNGLVDITAGTFVVKDQQGNVMMLIENGKINADLIDVGTLIARRVIVGDEKKQRVEIIPENKSVDIYNTEGDICSVFEGNEYAGIEKLYGGETGDIDITSKKGTATLDATHNNADLKEKKVISAVWHTNTSTEVSLLSGHLYATAYSPSATVTGNGGSIDGQLRPIQTGPHSSAQISISVETYSDEELNNCISSKSIVICAASASGAFQADILPGGTGSSGNGYYPSDTKSSKVDGKTKKTLVPAGYHRLVAHILLSVSHLSGSAGVKWGSSVSSGTDIAAKFISEFYISRYFANGFCLARSKTDYIMAYKTERGMEFITENGGNGLRHCADGLQYRIGGSTKWMSMPRLICKAEYYFNNSTSTYAVKDYNTFDNVAPKATRADRGLLYLGIPDAWTTVFGSLSNSRLIVNVHARHNVIDARVISITAGSIKIGLSDDETGNDCDFGIEIYII